MSKNPSKEQVSTIFIKPDAQLELEYWSHITNWKVNDIITFLELTNVSFPLKMDYNKQINKFTCIDSKQVSFNIELKSNTYDSSSTLKIEYDDRSYTYFIDGISKNFKYSDKIRMIGSTVKNPINKNTLETSNEVYKTYRKEWEGEIKAISKKLYIGRDHVCDISIVLTDTNKLHILDNIDKNSNVFDRYLLELETSLSAVTLVPQMIKDLKLNDEDLEVLQIMVAFKYEEVITSKIYLNKNVVEELLFYTGMYYFDIYKNGKCIISSADGELNFTLKNLYLFSSDYYTANDPINKDDVLINFKCSISLLKKVFETISQKQWIDPVKIIYNRKI